MHQYDVKRLALILAIQAEVEGMKAENSQREVQGSSPAYLEDAFSRKALELRALAHQPDETL